MAATIKHLREDGATQITQKTWPDAFAGINQTPGKFFFENVGDRILNNVVLEIGTVGVSDGSLELRTVLDSNTPTLTKPYGPTTAAVSLVLSAPGAGGTWAGVGVKGYRVTAVNALGETIGSDEATVNVVDVTQTVTVNWQAVAGATGYRVYRTDTPGTYVSPSLRASPAAPPFVDTGGAVGAGAPPVDNRTAGWFTGLLLSAPGSGGVWGGTGIRYWRVTALDSTGAILAASLENSVNVDVTTKVVTVSWLAVPGAASYNVYRSTISGVYTSPALRANVLSPTLLFVDNGAATVAGTLTQAPSYGVPPAAASFGTAALAIGSVAIGQQIPYWVNRLVPPGTPETGNPRVATIRIRET